MAGSEHEIPLERLPPDFARRLEALPEPAVPRPAATVVVLREGEGGGSEVLLLRRSRSAGFVPGAYVFPGGRVDRDDGAPELLARLRERTPEAWVDRLGMEDDGPGGDFRSDSRADVEVDSGTDAGTAPGIPGAAFLAAALRETFEETGLLVARDRSGAFAPSAAQDPEVARLRARLLAEEVTFLEVLESLELELDDGAAEYIAHWITPEAEPRRYDTRFFAVRVPRQVPVSPWEEEITHHLWMTPGEALARWREGKLPMIFPTVRTLEEMEELGHPEAVLAHFVQREIPVILPRLVRTETGVGIEVPTES